ncbi:MAG: hypothetical protein K2M08_00060 [Anaeroplasmataceae bacterium]|nr:hypothetical protein [Anaeroplasmataceae bacterium]
MGKFIDRQETKDILDASINDIFIVIVGKDPQIGKSAFMHEYLKDKKGLIFQYDILTDARSYWVEFVSKWLYEEKKIDELLKIIHTNENLIQTFSNINSFDDLNVIQEVVEKLSSLSISEFDFYQAINNIFPKEEYTYFCFDDTFMIDSISLDKIKKLQSLNNRKVYFTYDETKLNWKSELVKDSLKNITSVNIKEFKEINDYALLLSQFFLFESESEKTDSTRILYTLLKGNPGLLVNSIKEFQHNVINPNSIRQFIDFIREKFNEETNLNKTIKLFFAIFVISEENFTKDEIAEILGLSLPDEVFDKYCYISGMMMGRPVYSLSYFYYNLLKLTSDEEKIVINLLIQFFLLDTNRFTITSKLLKKIKNPNEFELKGVLLNLINSTKNIEEKIFLIDYFSQYFIIENSFLPKSIHSYAELLFINGYYESAYKYASLIDKNQYKNLILIGDIEFLLSLPSCSDTYKLALNISSNAIEELEVVSKLIMALSIKKDTISINHAEKLFKETLKKYKDSEEIYRLYRYSNNIMPFSESIKLTSKALSLCKNKSEEYYKIQHNITMMKLALYDNVVDLNYVEEFDQVFDYFKNKNLFHEAAYPLVNKGTFYMYLYIKTRTNSYLEKAIQTYSLANMYARSYYARNIAKTGWLIANSYYIMNNANLIKLQFLRECRKNIYSNIKNVNYDVRAKRYIYLSLVVSAKITNDIEEAKYYLKESKEIMLRYEKLKYNALCIELGCDEEMLDASQIKTDRCDLYVKSTELVPWVISFGH